MKEKVIENNQVEVVGEIAEELIFHHKVFGEIFYMTKLRIRRLSDTLDVIPVVISERLLSMGKPSVDELVLISGQFRSYNNHSEGRNKLELYVFAREVEVLDIVSEHENDVYLEGNICKAPTYRETPRGRGITDIFLAVNRPYGKSDYIPCICWGRNAVYAGSLEVGTYLRVFGRVQSREYIKSIGDGMENRTAYEISIVQMS